MQRDNTDSTDLFFGGGLLPYNLSLRAYNQKNSPYNSCLHSPSPAFPIPNEHLKLIFLPNRGTFLIQSKFDKTNLSVYVRRHLISLTHTYTLRSRGHLDGSGSDRTFRTRDWQHNRWENYTKKLKKPRKRDSKEGKRRADVYRGSDGGALTTA